MTAIDEIKTAIMSLTNNDLHALRAWIEEYEAQQWDNQIERDIQAGKLDKLAAEAIADFKAGRCKKL